MRGRETDDEPSRERVTLRLPSRLLERVDAVAATEYDGNRSAAARAALETLVDDVQTATDGEGSATITGEWPSADEYAAVSEPVRELRSDGGQRLDDDGGSFPALSCAREAEAELDARACRAWREVGHEAVWLLFMNAQADVDDALAPIETALCDDRPVDETAVRDARRRLDELRHTLEEYIAPLADGVDPWDDGAGSTVPYSVMREQLEARGYTVEKPEYSGA